ncbi:hypothetical protein LDENG_00108350 [Lucifuga dentata]|nr:hypothetical protein LDENG_00108350 [Lucifuga dentata]
MDGDVAVGVKRGSDELNMYSSSPNSMTANGSDSKKQRLDESPPSRVLHIRKLPNEVSETEVIALGLPFGKVTNILMLKGKNQGDEDNDGDPDSENIDSEEEDAFADRKDPLLNIDHEAPEYLSPAPPPPDIQAPGASAQPTITKAAAARARRAATAKQKSADISEPRWMNRENEDELPRQFPFCPRRTPGPQLDPQKDYSPKELFQLFFTRKVLNTLCANTNKNIRRKRIEGLKTALVEVNPEIMLKFISLVIYLGLVKPSAMRDLWRKDRLHCHPFPASVMPGWKFEAIMSFLHMSDPEEDSTNDQLKGTPDYDALFRIKPLQDQILEACKAYYHPFQQMAIDERMVAMKGHHSMKQYMKDKPTKWGFKLFVLADSRNGYTWNFSVYQGKAIAASGNGLSFDSVVNLIHVPLLGTGYHIYVDNFYTSATLFRHLYSMNYAACGTVREARFGYPRSKVNSLPENAERGDMRWIRDDRLLFVKWKDMRDISMCSTIHKAHSGQTVQRRVRNRDGSWGRRAVPVPDAVLDYNCYMGGVDLSDALIKYYTVTQKTMRWYRKFFLHFVDIAIVNSFTIQKELAKVRNKTPLSQKSFREKLCLELAGCGGNTHSDADPQSACSQTPPEPRPKTPEAFLELGTEEAAITMVNYYTAVTPQVRNTPVFIQYSNHKELKTDSALNQRAQAVLQAVSAVQDGSSPSSDPGVLDLAPPPSPVLRIIIDNMFYPVTLDVLQQIFSKFGTVMKIITFTKNNQFQALLQFSDPVNAQQAKLSLDGQNIYNSCCTLRIDFSKLVNLNVKYNNDKSRDYTRPDLPAGDGDSSNKDHSLLGTPSGALASYSSGGGYSSSLSLSQGGGAISPLSAAAAAAAAAGRVALSGSSASGVLLASNLNDEMVTPQSLFTLFGVYGDVQRVKILYNKKDCALIQLSDGNQAQLAMSHLNGQKVFGKVMRVTLSKHQTVALPREGLDDQLLTKDFSGSPLHRFKKPGSKNFQNIYPPSATLHLSNIRDGVGEDDLRLLFSNSGGVVKAFKFFQDRKMSLIQMSSVEEAIQALMELHNYDMGGNHHLKVSFSKSTI